MSKNKLFKKHKVNPKIKKRKRLSKLDRLPIKIREEIDRLMLEESFSYRQVEVWLQDRGHNISKTTIGRYGKRFFDIYHNVRRFETQAKLFANDSDKDMRMEAVVSKMILQKITDALINDDLDILEHSTLITAFASLQNSNATRERLLAQLAENTARVAADVSVTVKQRGLSEDEAEKIRVKILGASL